MQGYDATAILRPVVYGEKPAITYINGQLDSIVQDNILGVSVALSHGLTCL